MLSKRVTDHTGKEYNRLTVLSFSRIDPVSRQAVWNVICDCGVEKEILSHNLKTTVSCGCWQREITHLTNLRSDRVQAAILRVFSDYRHHAKQRHILWKLSLESFTEIIQDNCHYCSKNPENGVGTRGNDIGFMYSGIDRKDNSRGYVEENCVPCCKSCNNRKFQKPYEKFIKESPECL